jgi:hypothetical protein
MDDTQFETGDSGASDTYPMQCSALRKNGFVMLKVCSLATLKVHQTSFCSAEGGGGVACTTTCTSFVEILH